MDGWTGGEVLLPTPTSLPLPPSLQTSPLSIPLVDSFPCRQAQGLGPRICLSSATSSPGTTLLRPLLVSGQARRMPHRQRSFPLSASEAQGAFYEEDNDAFRKRYVSLLSSSSERTCTALTDTGFAHPPRRCSDRHILERRCLFIAEESQAEVGYYSPSIGEGLQSVLPPFPSVASRSQG